MSRTDVPVAGGALMVCFAPAQGGVEASVLRRLPDGSHVEEARVVLAANGTTAITLPGPGGETVWLVRREDAMSLFVRLPASATSDSVLGSAP